MLLGGQGDAVRMPSITVQSSPLSIEKKRDAARVLTDELSRITGIPAEKITVFFQELPPENIASGGILLPDIGKQ